MMLNTSIFCEELKKYGFEFYCGVPCSFLKPMINYAINHGQYFAAANEGDAVGICAGVHMGGKKAIVLMQNSGLANAVSPLTSLNPIFEIPVLGFVSLRGETGLHDEPQHSLMGKITTDLLSLMGIEWEYLSGENLIAKEQITRANRIIENNKSFFFVVRKDSFENEKLLEQSIKEQIPRNIVPKIRENDIVDRMTFLRSIIKNRSNDMLLLASTGFVGRELYQINDDAMNFYMVGSMGCISSIGLGLSIAQHDKKVVAIDGDGALLMRMGAMATSAYYNPANMLHILFDNQAYESTGAQATTSANINWVELAASVGYENSVYIHDIRDFEERFRFWDNEGGLTFMYVKTKIGTVENLKRPIIKPCEVKTRMMKYCNVF